MRVWAKASGFSDEQVIHPGRAGLTDALSELKGYRDLVWLFARVEYTSKIKQTALGPVWFVLQPLATALIFYFIFHRIAGIQTGAVPPILLYLLGLALWNYFAQSTSGVALSLTQFSHIYSKVYLPRLVIPLSVTVAKLFPFGIQLGLFLFFFVATGAAAEHTLNWQTIWIPLVVLQVGVLALGVGLLFAALSVQYRDLQQALTLVLQLWLYASPVIYPLSAVPLKYQVYLVCNPMTPALETLRAAFFGGVAPLPLLGLALVQSLLILIVGLVFFQRVQHNFIDTV